MSRNPRFIVLDTAAHGYDGHSFAYSAEVLKAASEEGLDTVLVGSTALRDAVSPPAIEVVPSFTRDCYGRWARQQPLSNRILLGVGRKLGHLLQWLRPQGVQWRASLAARAVERWFLSFRFAIELLGALRRIDARPDDALLMGTLDEAQVRGWSLALSLVSARRLPTTALLFRHNLGPGGTADGNSRPRAAVNLARDLARIRGASVGQRVHFVSDSRRLAQQHEQLTGFTCLPVPNVVPLYRPSEPRSHNGSAFHFVYLGNVRPEKGFALLLRAIRELPAGAKPRLAFTLQLTPNLGRRDPHYEAALDGAKSLTDRGVHLVTRTLPPEEYDELLLSADAVLVPYEPRTYFARTSQIFSEAVAAGRLVVVSADTWMEEQLDEMRGGGLAFSPYEPAALARALADLAATPRRYVADPGAVARWCADNSARALVRFLTRLGRADVM